MSTKWTPQQLFCSQLIDYQFMFPERQWMPIEWPGLAELMIVELGKCLGEKNHDR
jgi:hypothetical protein